MRPTPETLAATLAPPAATSRLRASTAAVAAVLALAASLLVAGPARPAGAGLGTGNPRLTVSNITVNAAQVAEITVTGTDYLVPPHTEGTSVFGGVYVFFGWVSDGGRFGPSIRNSSNNDGTFGVTYAYSGDGGDAGTRDDGTGTMRLVSFTPGGESGAATDYHMDRNGDWTTQMKVYGSTFTYTYPPTGEERTVDCQQVQCGIFTIGAHGKPSATNERFTPISFVGIAPPEPIQPGGGQGGTTPTTGPSGGGGGGASPTPGGGGGSFTPSPGRDDQAAPSSTTTTTGAEAATEDEAGGDDGRTDPDADGDGTADALEAAAGAGASSTLPDGTIVATGVSSSRSTGGGAGVVLVALVVGAAAVAVFVGVLRRRRRAQPAAVEVEP